MPSFARLPSFFHQRIPTRVPGGEPSQDTGLLRDVMIIVSTLNCRFADVGLLVAWERHLIVWMILLYIEC